MENVAPLGLMIFLAAILYSSVGHAGASGYLAAMALMGTPPDVMKPTALVLNIVVGTIATTRYVRAECFSWRIFWPFAVASIPLSFVGGAIRLPGHVYRIAVGVVLLWAAFRLVRTARKLHARKAKSAPLSAALVAGGGIGLLSGLTGTGGGIFLSPLLLLSGWADVRQCAGVTAAFVLVNSVSGLAGNIASVHHLPSEITYLAAIAGFGGLIGSELGSRRLAPTAMRYLLGAVLVVAGVKMILFP
jgi:uncharacterized membrane protein YfcA